MSDTIKNRVTLHMLFDEDLKQKIEKLSRNWHVSFSTTVNSIFEEMFYCVEKVDFIKKSITPEAFKENYLKKKYTSMKNSNICYFIFKIILSCEVKLLSFVSLCVYIWQSWIGTV